MSRLMTAGTLALILLACIVVCLPSKSKEPTMPRFYLAGPMRSKPEYNFPAFDAARDRGRALGFDVISPADLDRDSGDLEGGPPADGREPDDAFMREAVRRDVEVILSLRRETCDGVAVLPDWEASGGAFTELCVATCWLRGLRVLNAETWEPFTEEEIARIDFSKAIERIKAALRKRD